MSASPRRTITSLALLACLLLLATAALPAASAFHIIVDAHAEECFFDVIERDSKFTLSFQVSEGGFLDIDVKITDPQNKIVYSGERETDAKYTFAAEETGRYTYCFSNKMSSMTPKELTFTVDIAKPAPPITENEAPDMLDQMVQQLYDQLIIVRRDQEYMEIREATHRNTNDSTNSRVVWWSFFEAIVLVTMAMAQIFYLKRFFEVKRNV